MEVVGRARALWTAMPKARRSKLVACGLMLAAACAAVGWWSTRTDWKTLYNGMESRDLQQVEGELAAASITYQTTADGQGVQVPAELMDKARMEIATKGMPQSGRMGFELFDKPNWVGSEFDEKVNYQRALEGELEHTIATVSSVRSARVHLVLAKDSLFTEQQQPAKASVVLKLKRSTLAKEEVESIRNLVAGAVEGLAPDQVTLVDADGRANLNAPGTSAVASEEEQALADKLVAMLEPLAGRENVRATVNIAYDQSSQERTDEIVDPAQVATLQTQKTAQISGGTARPQGVPGTASNTPAADASGKANLPVYPTAGTQPQSATEESSTFAVTKHTVHEEIGPGRIARVSAAVLINDRPVMEGQGTGAHTVWRPRTIDEMKRLQELAQAAVGFDDKRGDAVVLQNIGFSANAPEPEVTGFAKTSEQVKDLLRAQPELLKTVGAGLAVMLLILFVVRPVAAQTMAMLRERPEPVVMPAQMELPTMQESGALRAGAEESDADRELYARAQRRRAAIDDEGVLEYVTAHVRRDPQQSVRLLEAWIGSKEKAA
jgi:flagellar M-ring protein FliF